MSTILEALKKLEHDKAKCKSGPPELDLEFLESPPPAPRRSPLKGVLMVVLLLACGGAATYLFLLRAEKAPAPAPAAPRAWQLVSKPATSAHPAAPLLTNRKSANPPIAAPPPPVQTVQQPAPAPLAAKPPQPATKAKAESPPTQAPDAKQRPPQSLKAPKPQLRSTLLPSLTVNGIALSDGEKRNAIVNGMSVSVGSTVEGARVEDILEHRVRFSYGGKTFEISVGSTGP